MGQHESKASVEARVQVLLLGLDNAGKSTLLYKLKHNASVSTVPTIGFNVEMLDPPGYDSSQVATHSKTPFEDSGPSVH
uniref:Uncharacterized protein n=1 Tax=Poecilia mexicana TaxID=48701 RepID=A0A3B3YEE5_9TELE